MIKCMVLNFNQSVSAELYFLWNDISKTLRNSEVIYGRTTGQAFTETQGTFKQKDSSKKTSSFFGLSKKLYLSLADFTKTLAIKVKL